MQNGVGCYHETYVAARTTRLGHARCLLDRGDEDGRDFGQRDMP